jgi:hypothetical protein
MSGKQLQIVGTERPVDPDIEAAGEKHSDAIKSHTKSGVKRKDTKLELIRIMREKKVTQYVHVEGAHPFVIDLSSEDKIKISPYKGAVDSDEQRAKKKNSKRKGEDEDEGGEAVN